MNKQIHSDVPAEWKTLVLDYLENSMTDEQFQKLRQLIEKPAFQRLLAEYAIDQSILRELTRSEELAEGLNALPSSPPTSVECAPATNRAVAATKPAVASKSSVAREFSRRLAVFATIAAVLLVMLTAVISSRWNPTPTAVADSIQIQSIAGKVTIEDRPVKVGMILNEGKLFSTEGVASFARLAYDDGTSLLLAGSSAVICSSKNGQKFIEVKQGDISASVTPQPTGKPLLIITDTARMEVVGTNLAISASQSSTRLDVTEGKVKIQERSLGNQADVSAGNYAVANVGEMIEVAQQAAVPNTWKLDFEQGLPQGWQQGIWEQEEPSPSSNRKDSTGKRSVGAVRQSYSPENSYYSIVSPNAWSEGLFRVCENSYLEFRVKMARPEWYQVMLMTRDEGFRSSVYQGGFEYQEPNTVDGAMKLLPPNQWRTIRVPLSSFKRTAPRKYESIETPFDERPADPPRVGDVVFTLFFGTQTEDRGLVVDDISVTVE